MQIKINNKATNAFEKSIIVISIASLATYSVLGIFLYGDYSTFNNFTKKWTAFGQSQNASNPTTNTNFTALLETLVEAENISIYENSTYGIIMAYPSTWEINTPINLPGDRNIFIVEFNVPDTPVSLYVARDTFDQNKTLSTYLAETVESYSQDTPGFTLLSSDLDSAQLAGNPGYSILFTSGDNETGAITLTKEIGTIIGDTDMVYYIQYVADIDEYSLYETVADQMIDSLEIHIQDANATETVEEQDLTGFLEELAANAGEI
jgi:hypothetical protein